MNIYRLIGNPYPKYLWVQTATPVHMKDMKNMHKNFNQPIQLYLIQHQGYTSVVLIPRNSGYNR